MSMVTSKSKAQIYFFIIEVDHVLCHAVPLGMILPITAPSVWHQLLHSLTDHKRSLWGSHELISLNHSSSAEFIIHISYHSLISPSYPHQNSWRFPPVSEKLILTSDHKQRRKIYRHYDTINNCHYLAWFKNSAANVGH